MEQRSELLPCPFCGEMPAVEMTGFHLGARTIYCAGNDCMGPITTAQNMDDATIQWNRRATQPAAPAGDAVAWGRVIDGKAVTISLVRTEANDEPLYAAPAQSAEGRVPKVRTSHHRNKEEAERLQKLVNERYAQCSADIVEACAQALANDYWHPPQKLSILAKHDAEKFRRQARLVLGAASVAQGERNHDATEMRDLRQSVTELRDWKAAVLGCCKACDGFEAMHWGGDKDGWGFVMYFISHLNTRALNAEKALAMTSTQSGAGK